MEHREFLNSETTLYDSIMVNKYHIYLLKSTEYITPGVRLNVNCGFWVIMMDQCSFIDCSREICGNKSQFCCECKRVLKIKKGKCICMCVYTCVCMCLITNHHLFLLQDYYANLEKNRKIELSLSLGCSSLYSGPILAPSQDTGASLPRDKHSAEIHGMVVNQSLPS